MKHMDDGLNLLDRESFLLMMEFMTNTLKVCSEEKFHKHISDFASYFGYKYILYGYMNAVYSRQNEPCIVNISNPAEWAKEYDERCYYDCDPVLRELEIREQAGLNDTFILWDTYDRELSFEEEEVIRRRKYYGLEYGFSSYENSLNKSFVFLISFASEDQVAPYMPAVMDRVISHLSAARKRLDILKLISCLSERETDVADQLVTGKASCEIAAELSISESTVKFHLTKIYDKLGVSRRQEAISLLLAARYLCITE